MQEQFLTPEQRAAAERLPNVYPMDFWEDMQIMPDKTTQTIEWVKWAKRGTNSQAMEDKVSRVMRDRPEIWAVLQPYYAEWKKGNEITTLGTPLTTVSFVNKSQVQSLKFYGIYSVEDLAKLTDSQMDSIGMGARKLRDSAFAFLQNREASIDASNITALIEDNKTKQQQIDELVAAVADLRAANSKTEKPFEPSRRIEEESFNDELDSIKPRQFAKSKRG